MCNIYKFSVIFSLLRYFNGHKCGLCAKADNSFSADGLYFADKLGIACPCCFQIDIDDLNIFSFIITIIPQSPRWYTVQLFVEKFPMLDRLARKQPVSLYELV